MSRLEELLKEYCPDGVEFRKVGDIAVYEQPGKYLVSNTHYDNSYQTPVLTAGQTFILGYTDEKTGIYPASKDNPVIIFDDFTGAFKWVDFPFKAKSSAMKMITAQNGTMLRYIYHLMGNIGYVSTEHKRLWIGFYSELKVPVPPLPVQQEIVRILDLFTNLEAELEAELKLRKKQYEWYRDQLLTFPRAGEDGETLPQLQKMIDKYASDGGGVEWKSLDMVAIVIRGERITKKQLVPTGKYKVISGGIEPMGRYDKYNRNAFTITIASYGAAGYVNYIQDPFWANDVCLSVFPHENIIVNKYLYYYLKHMQKHIFNNVIHAVPEHIPTDFIKNLQIPIPPLQVQEEIVRILDNFSTLVTDLSSGLPAEIAAIHTQYEYYRDKLLTFEPLAA